MAMNMMRSACVALFAGLMLWNDPVRADDDSDTHYTIRFLTESGFPSELRTMCFSPDSSILAASVHYKGVSFIRTEDGETEKTYNKGDPFSMAYSKDGSRLFMISESSRELIDVKSMKPIQFNGKPEPGSIGLTVDTRNGKLVVTQLTPGSPAERSEQIKLGGELVGVGEGRAGAIRQVVGSSEKQAIALIRGVAGTYVRLEIIPKGKLNSTTVTLQREAVREVNGESKFVPFQSDDENENMTWCMTNNQHTFCSSRSGEVHSVIRTEDIDNVGVFAWVSKVVGGSDFCVEVHSLAEGTLKASSILNANQGPA